MQLLWCAASQRQQHQRALTSWLALHVKHLQVCVGVAVGAVHAGGARMHQHRLVAEVTLQAHAHTTRSVVNTQHLAHKATSPTLLHRVGGWKSVLSPGCEVAATRRPKAADAPAAPP